MPKRIRHGSKVSNARMVKLYFVEGLTISEIAAKCHIGQSTLYSRCRRLGIKLRSRSEAKKKRQLEDLEMDKKKLRDEMLQRWQLNSEEVFINETELNSVLDRPRDIKGKNSHVLGR
jgi:transposase